MSLRTKLLVLFLALAVAQLLILGAVARTRSLQALETMIAAQNPRVAERVAATVAQRAALLQSDMLFLSENVEIQPWLAAGDPVARAGTEQFLGDARARMSLTYVGLTYAGPDGAELFRLGTADPAAGDELEPIAHPITDTRSATPLGTLRVRARIPAIIPLDVLATGLGQASQGLVIDRGSRRFIYVQNGAAIDTVPDPALIRQPPTSLSSPKTPTLSTSSASPAGATLPPSRPRAARRQSTGRISG